MVHLHSNDCILAHGSGSNKAHIRLQRLRWPSALGSFKVCKLEVKGHRDLLMCDVLVWKGTHNVCICRDEKNYNKKIPALDICNQLLNISVIRSGETISFYSTSFVHMLWLLYWFYCIVSLNFPSSFFQRLLIFSFAISYIMSRFWKCSSFSTVIIIITQFVYKSSQFIQPGWRLISST